MNIKEINEINERYLWYKGKQYILVEEYCKALRDLADTDEMLINENEKLYKEVEYYKERYINSIMEIKENKDI